MTVLLYNYRELEERAAEHLRVWKVWHLILYFLAAIFGIGNYILLQSTMELVDYNCVLYPRTLEFITIVRSNYTNATDTSNDTLWPQEESLTKDSMDQNGTVPMNSTEKSTAKRETAENKRIDDTETMVEIQNVTIITGNKTHQLVLDTSRTLFATPNECEFAEYMPLMSAVCALVWATLFVMCPGGGRSRTGLQQPWRILAPALVFALVLMALTAHSFARTNGGLHDFCAAFFNLTNSTTCSSVEPFLENYKAGQRWGLGARMAATRAASAGAWAAWAAGGALLLARCLAAPDFNVRSTAVTLKRDPAKKITPHLRKSGRKQQRPAPSLLVSPETTSLHPEYTRSEQNTDLTNTSDRGTPLEDGIEMTPTTQMQKDR